MKTNEDILVSISCITFNHGKFIQDAIEGFLMQQTSFKFEILIHDDASADETVEIIRTYEKKWPNILKPIYQQDNQYSRGISLFLNYQFPRARGRYIALCEGDDYWTDPYKLQKQVDFLESHNEFSGCAHQVNVIYSNDPGKTHPFRLNKVNSFHLNDLMLGRRFHTASIMFRSEIFRFQTLPQNILSGDKAMIFLISSYGPIHFFDEIMGVYRKHDSGASSNPHIDFYRKDLNILPWIKKINPRFPSWKFKAHLYRTMARSYGNTWKTRIDFSLKYLFYSFSYFPGNILEILRFLISHAKKNRS